MPNLFGLGNQRAVNTELPPKVDTTVRPTVDTTPSINPMQMTNVGSSPLTRTNPSFLGSNPDDILKNLDIARRTG